MRASDDNSDHTVRTSPPSDDSGQCPEGLVTPKNAIIDNLPYLVMILTGALLFRVSLDGGVWAWPAAGLYLAYGIAGALWIMLFVCPYCHFYDTRLCPCGYGKIAARLRARKDGDRFARQFRKHIPAIVPLWFIPPIAVGFSLWHDFSWLLLGLLVVFAINSFVILPLVSKKYGCADCPQKENCPWMGTCRTDAE